MDLYLTIAIAIIGYTALVVLFPKLMPDDSKRYTKEALERIYRETRSGDTPENTDILRSQLREEAPLVRWFFSLDMMKPLYEASLQSGYQHDLKSFVMLIAGSFAASFVFALLLGLGLLALPVGMLLGYYIPLRHCKKRIAKRNAQFLDQFPEALDMIVRSVRSGFPLNTALQMVADTCEDPVRSEFRQVVDEISAGRGISQVLARLASRINEQDVKFFAVVLSVQQETGGNLAEIIGNLASILRKRKQLRHKIHSLTAEGRATGLVLGSLPVIVFAALYFARREYIMIFFTDPTGNMLLGVVGGLIVATFLIVRRMIKVDI
jgi:tight adherence protein B